MNNKKKISIIVGTVMAVFIFTFACFQIFTKSQFNGDKIKGSVSQTGNSWITCSDTSLSVGGTTTCSLYVKYSDTLRIVEGTVSASNLTINSVTKTVSGGLGDNGTRIGYTGLEVDTGSGVAIASISVTASSAGTGTISFSNATESNGNKSDRVTINSSTNITVTNPAPQPSSNANLGSLSVSNANIGTFNPNTTSYGANVANSVTSVTINATPADSNANVSGTGAHSLSVGNNSFQVIVRAENGTTKTYTININRAASSVSTNNNIGSIVVRNGNSTVNIGTVSATKITYTATVANNVSSVNVSATPADSNASITGNLGDQKLYVGVNTLVINVRAQSGATKTYTLKITRSSGGGGSETPKSSICTLSKLAVSGTTISNNFSSTVYSYKASVKNNVSSVTITATPTDSKANVKGTGIVTLKVGNNSHNIEVTAENGSKKIYNIVIVREGSNGNNGSSNSNNGNNSNNSNNSSNNKKEEKKDSEALLKELIVDGKEMKLTDDNFSYNYTVLYEINSVKVKATPKSDKAKVKIVGNDDIQVGKNTIMITVTAEDGTEKIYLVNVTRKEQAQKLSDDSTLSELKIEDYDIEFDPAVHTYTVKIKNEDQLVIDYTAGNENSNVVISGNEKLKNGSVITIEVTAEDGSVSRYEITVKKSGGSKLFLFIILGLILLGGVGALLYFLVFNKKDKKVKEEPQEIASFSQADVYDEYVKNTQVPSTNDQITEEAAMISDEPSVNETQVTDESPFVDTPVFEEPGQTENLDTPVENAETVIPEEPVDNTENVVSDIPVETTTDSLPIDEVVEPTVNIPEQTENSDVITDQNNQ